MKRPLITLAFALLLGCSSALAASYLICDDSGVDYENTSLSKVYLGIDYVDGHLVIRLDDDWFDGALASRIDFDVPDLATQTDFFGNEFNADLSDISDLRWTGINDNVVTASYLVGMDATHLGTTLDDAIADYDALFRRLGFTAEVTDTVSPNVKLVTFSNGTSTVSTRLHSMGGDVHVALRSM